MEKEPVEKLPDKRELHNLVQKYKKELSERSRYDKGGEMLEWLFKTFPNNTDINEVLVKVMSLDSSYSTNLRGLNALFRMAMKIISISNFNEKIKNCDLSLVDELCNLKTHNYDGEDIVNGNPFTFASKYCCLQNICLGSDCTEKLKQYAIYDSFVAKVLTWYQENDDFLKDTELKKQWIEKSTKQKASAVCKVEALKTSYQRLYYPIVLYFQNNYELSHISLRDLDHLLWRMGQEHFLDYNIEKLNDYVVKVEGKNKLKITVYARRSDSELDKLPMSIKYARKSYERYEKESDYDYALRLLKDFYVCVRRKEGIVGDYYVQADKNKTIKLFHKVLYVKLETKKKSPSDILNDIIKATNATGLNINENGNIINACKEIVRKYAKNKDEQKQTEGNEN